MLRPISRQSQDTVSLVDFTVHGLVGEGEFGRVMLAAKNDTGKMYAFKELSKGHIKARKAESCVWDERKTLALVESPFVVGLRYAFQTDKDLVLVLDLCTGGDIKYHLRQNGTLGRDQARFTCAEVALGLAHLHGLGHLCHEPERSGKGGNRPRGGREAGPQ